MNKRWIALVLTISFMCLTLMSFHQQRQLQPSFFPSKSYVLPHFQQARKALNSQDQDLLELWESMLTGRSGPVAGYLKQRYAALGLNHLFTPSGFHLSAVLVPIFKILPSKRLEWFVLLLVAFLVFCLRGQQALKRMVLVKIHQRVLGRSLGFIIALVLDLLSGSLNGSPLSFIYSFLFLGIIYSGTEGLVLMLLFFTAQVLICFFNGLWISPLLILVSPLLNLLFGLALPFLCILAFPLWNWQLQTGLFILRVLQASVDGSARLLSFLPVLEVTSGLVLILILILLKQRLALAPAILIFCGNLNLDKQRVPSVNQYEFKPNGEFVKVVGDVFYFKDGKCRRKLVRGIWWERCSPRRESTRKQLKKPSYPS